MELNTSSITLGSNTINRLENSYIEHLKDEYKISTLMTSSAEEDLINNIYPKSIFMENFIEDMLYDRTDLKNGCIYGYTINGNILKTSDKTSYIIYIPKILYTVEGSVRNFITTIEVNKAIEKIYLSRVFTKLNFINNTEEILNVYFPNLDLSQNLSSDCFYITGHGSTYIDHNLTDTTIISQCAGIVLGKDFFNGYIDETKTYGDFSNVNKLFVYYKCISDDLIFTNERLKLVSKVLNIDISKIFFYNDVNNIYEINNTTENEFENANIVRPTCNTINIDTISLGKRFVLDCSKLKGTIVIVRSKDINYLLTSLIIGEEITAITGNFKNCVSLVSARLNVMTENMFENCYVLQDIYLSNSITNIPKDAFLNCYLLERVTLSNTVTTINNEAFKNCYKLSNITGSVDNIGDNTFENCHNLKFFDISSVTSLGTYVFSGCNSLTNISFPNLDFVVEGFCNNCENLRNITLPNIITNIKDNAFNFCSGLESISIPTTVQIIESNAFENCNMLRSLSIPESVTSLGSNAFTNCYNLKDVTCLMTTIDSNYDKINANVSSLTLNNNVSDIIATKLKSIFGFYETGTSQLTYSNRTVTVNSTYLKDIELVPTATLDGTLTLIKGGNIYYRLVKVTVASNIKTLGSKVFEKCYCLREISLPSSITNIQDNAFSYCYSLTGIDIPSGLKTIGKNVFQYCVSLTTITIPNNVTTLGTNAFYGCTNLVNAVISTSLKYIPINAFYGCNNLTFVDIPTSVTTISDYAFSNCLRLTELPPLNSIISIGCNSFKDCYNLKNIVFTDSVTSIEEGAFSNCYSINDVTLLNSIAYLGNNCFQNCYYLESISSPNVGLSIGMNAFDCCYNLQNVECMTLGNAIFYSDSSLNVSNLKLNTFASNYIKSTMKSIFGSDSYVERKTEIVYYSGTNPVIDYSKKYKNNIILLPDPINKPTGMLTKSGTGGNLSVKLIKLSLEGITSMQNGSSVGSGIFSNCVNLINLNLGKTLKQINAYAFSGCSNLKKVSFPNSVTTILQGAFYKCSNIKSITLPINLKGLSANAFDYCISLPTLNIPNEVSIFGTYVFDKNYNLKSITIPAALKGISLYSFSQCYSLSSIKLPSNLSTISGQAFANCYNLRCITIPSSVTTINTNVFTGCIGLKSVVCLILKNSAAYSPTGGKASYLELNPDVSDDVASKIKTMFGYESPGEVDIEYNSNTIDLSSEYSTDINLKPSQTTFSGSLTITSSLSSKLRLINLNIANGIDTIPDMCLKDFSCLQNITIPDTVTSIGSKAFENCYNLREITIPTSVLNINTQAFANCYGLSKLYIPSNVTSLGDEVFYNCNVIKDVTCLMTTNTGVYKNKGLSSKMLVINKKAPKNVKTNLMAMFNPYEFYEED